MTTIFNFLDILAWGCAACSAIGLMLTGADMIQNDELEELYQKYGAIVWIEEVKTPAIGLFVSFAWLLAPYV